MDLGDTPAHAAYRAEIRERVTELARDAPALGRAKPGPEDIGCWRAWQARLADAGLLAVMWPTEYGGQGLGPIEKLITGEELHRAGLPGPFDFVGLELIGPTIIAHGTAEQKAQHLGPILRGEEPWCQLFSEPAAGSDLAGVRTRAVADGNGGFRCSGQKVWTTNAHNASFGMLLARTDPEVPKHAGLTMFLVPMDADGVTVRGLRQIGGESHFNEVFLDDVRVGADAILGAVGGGWKTATTTLMYERLAAGFEGDQLGIDLDRFAAAIATDARAAGDPVVRERFGEIATDLLAMRYTTYRQLTTIARGGMPGPEGGLSKITIVGAGTAACDLVVDALGPGALTEPEWHRLTTLLPAIRSAGGTEEILRTMVGERVLGLPPEPRVDKGVPFARLRELERAAAG